MFVVDTQNHRMLRLSGSALVEVAAGKGAAGNSGDGGPARAAQLNQPGACAADSFGNVFLADTMNHRIRKVAPDGLITTVAGTGEPGSAGDGGPATEARLSAPGGIAVNDSGEIYIADTGNHRIRRVGANGEIQTIAGLGTAGFEGDGGSASEALLNSPAGLALDGAGTVYVADTGNHRVRRLVPDEEMADPVTLSEPEVVNAASRKGGPIAPGETIVISGVGAGPSEGVAAAYDSEGMLPFVLADCEVRFDGAPAPLFYVQSGAIHAQVPYGVAGRSKTRIEVMESGRAAAEVELLVAASAPGIYPIALNQDGLPNAAAEPASPGSTITIYATGEGLTDGANVTGRAAKAPYARPKLKVRVTIGGREADNVEAFSTPGVAGMLQVTARVPAGVGAGPAAIALQVGEEVSPEFSIWVK
jgi:uncharacterized protein (TIGR03437 family)